MQDLTPPRPQIVWPLGPDRDPDQEGKLSLADRQRLGSREGVEIPLKAVFGRVAFGGQTHLVAVGSTGELHEVIERLFQATERLLRQSHGLLDERNEVVLRRSFREVRLGLEEGNRSEGHATRRLLRKGLLGGMDFPAARSDVRSPVYRIVERLIRVVAQVVSFRDRWHRRWNGTRIALFVLMLLHGEYGAQTGAAGPLRPIVERNSLDFLRECLACAGFSSATTARTAASARSTGQSRRRTSRVGGSPY